MNLIDYERGPRAEQRRACIMKPQTQFMYCGKLRGARDGEGRTTAGSIAKWEPDIKTLCAACRNAWATELTNEVRDKMRLLVYLGSPYKRRSDLATTEADD